MTLLRVVSAIVVTCIFVGQSGATESCSMRDDPTSDSSFTAWANCIFQDHKKIKGGIYLREGSSGVEFQTLIKGLSSGKHGYHVHEFGSMDSEDGTCADTGSHFNPDGNAHGAYPHTARHMGDLGNLCVQRKVNAEKYLNEEVTLSGVDSLIGRSIVIHEDADDGTESYGDKLACCVIAIADEWEYVGNVNGAVETTTSLLFMAVSFMAFKLF